MNFTQTAGLAGAARPAQERAYIENAQAQQQAYVENERAKKDAANLCKEVGREVPEGIGRLYRKTDILSEVLAVLEQRLAPVLVSRPPQTGETDCAHASAATVLGQQLSELSARLELMTHCMLDLQTRLEL
jgi:hypothetical protein